MRTENNKVVRYLSDGEREALLVAAKASQWDKLYLLIILAITTGARRGEMLGLRWSDIDFVRGLAHWFSPDLVNRLVKGGFLELQWAHPPS